MGCLNCREEIPAENAVLGWNPGILSGGYSRGKRRGREGPRWGDKKANWIVINTEFLCFFGPWGLSPGLEVSNGLGLGSICSVKTSPGGSSSAKRYLRRRNLIRVRPVFPCLLPSVEILSSHPHLARARTQTHRHRHTHSLAGTHFAALSIQ